MTKTTKLLTAGAFLSFFVFGFVDNLKGAILPELLDALQLTDTQGGTIQLAAYLGFIITCFFTGILADLVGNRVVLIIAGICLTVGIAGFSIAAAFGGIIAFMFVFGIGTGAIEVGGNDLIVEIHGNDRGRFLNLLAVFHGIGALLVPLYVAGLLRLGVGWRPIVQVTLILSVLLFGYFLLVRPANVGRRNQTRGDGSSADDNGINWQVLRRQGFTTEMRWFYLMLGSYVSIELGLAAWMVEYLQRLRDVPETASQFYLSGFFVAIMAGRFLGSFVVERVGYLRSVALALTCALICIVVGLTSSGWLILLPGSGLFLSIVFPTIAAAVSERNEENAGSILGLLFTFGGLGGALGPWLIGIVSDGYGLQVGLACTIGFAVVSLLSLTMLLRHLSSA